MAPIDTTTAICDIPSSMLAEYGLKGGVATSSAYRCDEPRRVLISLGELRVPTGRALDPARLRRILQAIGTHTPLPAVPVFREPTQVVVLDGMHRVAVATALGFICVPCIELTLEEARDFYRYPEGQR
jgi:hypothetical protein